ncbi:Hsp33 family molecular chaperone HslO [Xanthomonas campestris pv. badrii]|uniref:Hsp33 family molecular chaperone HslO n=1 Tax=Xanthomonas campestris pv. badrii TaxID=149696 RepID=A0A7Z2VBE3_XANCA|nr:Hsp33 family molecular chaperone HslO [Xanthomonas campestris]QJD68477.1 Hsp33 family molecular chaperone HslO [Xanthomonas campestris pv. badrii]
MTDHDQLSRFLLPAAGVRGVHVRLTKAWHDIQGAAAYPPAARQLLGEAAVAAALFTGHTKVDGRLSVQLRGNDTLRTLFAECTAAGTLRGIVQLADGADAPTDLRELGEAALLAITIENPGLDPREPQRYQSLVAMQAPDLAEAFETYFQQSEQLPTRLLLAAGPDQAAGLLLQKLPGDEGDTDGWTRIGALFDTLGAPELLSVAGDDLLHRLFHDEDTQLMGSKPLSFGCSCSRERVASMLQSLGEEEARAAAEETGSVDVRCEFCGREYHFALTDLAVLFSAAQPSQQAPERLQ